MRKYDSYKDSGVEWIGEIPSGWDKLPLKYFGQVTLGKMLTPEDKGGNHLKPYLRSQNIQVERVDISDVKEMWFSDSELEKLKLKKGDLLFNEGGDVGRTCIWLNEIDECYFQNSVNRVRFETDNEWYFLYQSILYHSVGYYDSMVNRVSIPHLTKEKLESVKFLRPPLPEQQQIVSFLDSKTSQIDDLIQKKERKIELLKEYRTSLINQVVTKGLNPNVEMKDSGVEWIGEIPSHWEKSCVRYVTREHRQGYYSSDSYTEEGLRVVRITDLNDNRTISIENSPFYQLSDLEKERFMLKSGDFLFPRTGGVGRFGIFNDSTPSIYGSFLIRFRFSDKVVNQYMRYYFDSGIYLNQILSEIHGGVNQNVHVENIKDCKVFYPKKSEQQQIVEYLDEQTHKIDSTIQTEEGKIELLKEYRQSLISSVVTGKIDVRPDKGIPWFQKPEPKVTVHKLKTPMNGIEEIVITTPPIWGEEVFNIVLENLTIVNSLYSSKIQFNLVSDYIIPVGCNPKNCILLFKGEKLNGIYYEFKSWDSHKEREETSGKFYEINDEKIVEKDIDDRIFYWHFKELEKEGYNSYFIYYSKNRELMNTFSELKSVKLND